MKYCHNSNFFIDNKGTQDIWHHIKSINRYLSRRQIGPKAAFWRVLLTADFQAKGNEPPWLRHSKLENEKRSMVERGSGGKEERAHPTKTPGQVVACTKWNNCYWRNRFSTLFVKLSKTSKYPPNGAITSCNLQAEISYQSIRHNQVNQMVECTYHNP